MDRTVVDYKGHRVRIQCADEEIPEVVYTTMVAPFLSDFEYSWLTGTRAEERVKNYLGYVAGLMLRRPKDHGVVSPRRMRKIHGIELTLGTTDSSPKNIQPLPVKTSRKEQGETKNSRINAIRVAHPNSKITYCRVNTDNRFEYNSASFAIHQAVKAYAPKETSIGRLYDMDRIVVVDDAGKLFFYDQEIHPIDSDYVAQL